MERLAPLGVLFEEDRGPKRPRRTEERGERRAELLERNGSCWNSDSSQRSSASARYVSASAIPSRTSSSAASRRGIVEPRRLAREAASPRSGARADAVRAAVERLEQDRAGREGRRRREPIAVTASAISDGASGTSSPGPSAERSSSTQNRSASRPKPGGSSPVASGQ